MFYNENPAATSIAASLNWTGFVDFLSINLQLLRTQLTGSLTRQNAKSNIYFIHWHQVNNFATSKNFTRASLLWVGCRQRLGRLTPYCWHPGHHVNPPITYLLSASIGRCRSWYLALEMFCRYQCGSTGAVEKSKNHRTSTISCVQTGCTAVFVSQQTSNSMVTVRKVI